MATVPSPMSNTIVLAIAFLFVYTAFSGNQNLQSSINQAEGLGVASVLFVHCGYILTTVVAPLYIHLVGLKMTFIIAFLSHCIYTFSNFYPHWSTLIPASFFLGLASSPMWVGRSLYVNAMGQQSSQMKKTDLHGSFSSFNGVFFSISFQALVWGNLISSLVLQQSSTDQSDIAQMKICGADDCPGVEKSSTKIVRPEDAVINSLLTIYLVLGMVGVGITVLFLHPVKVDPVEGRRTSRVFACCTLFRDRKLLLLIPMKLSWAVNASIVTTGYTKAFVSCTVGVKMVGYVMTCRGIVTAFSAYGFGRLARHTGRFPLMAVSLMVDIVVIAIMLLWKPTTDDVFFLFLVLSILAAGEGIWSAQYVSLVGLAFPRYQSEAFSNLGTWGHVGYSVTLLADNFLCLRTKLYFAVIIWALGVIGYILMEFRFLRKSKSRINII